jgi:hypothetical protein
MNDKLLDKLHEEAENYGLHEDVRALLREAIDEIENTTNLLLELQERVE